MTIEIIILIAFFILSLYLVARDFWSAVVLLLILSTLLHKELFSIYRWDLLPVRVLMLSFLFFAAAKAVLTLIRGYSLNNLKEFFSDPFILLITAMWVVNGMSLLFTKNLTASIFLYGFFTTVTAFGIMFYRKYADYPEKAIKLVKILALILFGLSILALIQLFVYTSYDFIFGALWNVPGHLPRLGATFWDVNHFGALLAAVLPVLGVFILTAGSWRNRIVYAVAFGTMVIVLLLTNSRSAWILAFVSFISFLTIQLIRKWGWKGVAILLSAMILVAVPILMEYNDKDSPIRAKIRQYFHYRIDSFDSHFMLLEGAVEVFENTGYLGGGYGGFFEHFSKTEVGPRYFSRDPIALNAGLRINAHSVWGEALAETGIVGISVFVLLMGTMILTPIYVGLKNRDLGKSLVASAMASAMIGWLTAGIFYSYKAEFFWIVFFLYFTYSAGVVTKENYLKDILRNIFGSAKVQLAVIGVIAAVLLFINLGSNHLIPWDEAIYAKIAKNMVNSGDFVVLRWFPDVNWFEKPPLYMWLSAAAMHLIGVNEWAVRLPSALAGLGTILLVYIFAKNMFNRTAGFLSAFVLATTTQYIYYARASMLDVTTTFFITLAVYFYWKASREKQRFVFWILSGAAIGFGVLTKNVVGLLPFPILAANEVYLAVDLGFNRIKKLLPKYISLAAAFLLVSLPWHLVLYFKFGELFLQTYLGYHVLQRASMGIEDKGNPFYWYVIVIKVSMRIWFVALLGAFPFTIFRSLIKNSKRQVLLFIWFTVIFLFFSISKSKIVWYIIPLYPVAAIIVGVFIERFMGFIMSKFSRLNSPVFKGLAIYVLFVFGLFYLFLVRGLVYTSDTTGAQAMLLQQKDEIYGTEQTVYVDKVEMPLILYYTDGPFVQLEFQELREKLSGRAYDESVIFVTKESRLETYQEEIPEIELINNIGDYSLGFLESEYEKDLDELNKLEKELDNLQVQINIRIEKGELVTFDAYQTLDLLNSRKRMLEAAIRSGLKSTSDVSSDN